MPKTLYRAENIALAMLLRELRESAGLLQAALADRLGRSQTYVSNIEQAIRRLDLVELRDYCAALGVSLPELIGQWERRIGSPPRPRVSRSKAKP